MSRNEANVLLIEDNPGDVKLTSILLAGAANTTFHLETCERLGPGLQRLAQGGIDALLLDLSLPDSQGLATFERAHAASPTLPVVVMSNLDDEQIAMQAVEIGAQDYLVKGRVDSVTLTRALLFAVERQKQQKARTEQRTGKVLLFVGAKGGVGTTTVALNIASAIAHTKHRVIAVELRSDFGTFAPYLGSVPVNHLGSLGKLPLEGINEREILASLTEFPSGMKVLFGPQTNQDFGPIELQKAEVLLRTLSKMADYVVVDLPDATSEASRAAARVSKFGGVVLANDPVSVLCASRILGQLAAAGMSKPLMRAIAVNRSAAFDGMRLDDIAGQLGSEVVGLVVPAGDLCARAEKAGVPFVLLKPNHLASETILAMVQKLLAEDGIAVNAFAPWN